MTKSLIFPSQGVKLGHYFEDFVSNSQTFSEHIKNKVVINDNQHSPFLKHIILIDGMLEVLKKDFSYDITKHIKLLAGHSLGEFNAVSASGMIPFDTIFDILKKAEQIAKLCIKKRCF